MTRKQMARVNASVVAVDLIKKKIQAMFCDRYNRHEPSNLFYVLVYIYSDGVRMRSCTMFALVVLSRLFWIFYPL